jgi:phospholipid/cholesterol/gamma-HCH transport system substrate-binding protein
LRRLATLGERIRNTPGLLRDTVAVSVCIALAITCSAYILSHQSWQPPWQDTYTFSAEFDSAPAVRPESLQEVRIAGVTVGRITEAEPTEAGTAKITMSIEPEHRVYENARVLVRTKSPLNVMYVTLDPGGPPAAPLEEGATIPMAQTARAVQPTEIFDKLDEKARFGLTSLLNELDVTMAAGPHHLGSSLLSTRDAMASFQPVLDQLEARRENLRRLVTAFSDIASAAGRDDVRLAQLTEASHRTLAALASRDDKLAAALAALPGFTEQLRGSMTSVDTLTGELDPTLDELTRAADDLRAALRDLTGTVGAIRKFVNGADPVVDRAVPVLRDLRPLVADARTALTDLRPTVGYLPSATERIVPWMEDLAAFVYQTSSSFSLFDANGGLGRANLNVALTNPSGGLQGEGVPDSGGPR